MTKSEIIKSALECAAISVAMDEDINRKIGEVSEEEFDKLLDEDVANYDYFLSLLNRIVNDMPYEQYHALIYTTHSRGELQSYIDKYGYDIAA